MFNGINFCNEDRLLLLSSNIEASNLASPPIIPDIKDIDWNYIFKKNDYLFFAPALYLLMKKLKKQEKQEIIPESYYSRLRNIHYATAVSNIKLREQISQILRIFRNTDIRIIFLKGSDFLQTIYKDRIGIRWVSDMDILVRKEGLKDCRTLFLNAGYKEAKPVLIPFHHNLCLYKEELEKPIEIHYHLLHSAAEQKKIRIDIKEIFRDSQKISYLEHTLPVLSPEDSLLYRCIDLVNRHSSSLQCTLDISAIIYHYKNLNWEETIKKSFAWKVRFFIYRGLKFVKETAGVSIPKGIIEELGGSSSFFYNLFPADQQIFSHYYSIRIFIADFLRTAKKYKNNKLKYIFSELFLALDKKNILLKIAFLLIYIAAAILHLLRFICRGICNLVKATKFTHTIAYFLTVRYKNLKTNLNKTYLRDIFIIICFCYAENVISAI